MKKIFILLVLLVPTLSIWAAPDQLTNPAQAGAYWTLSCYSGNGSTNVDAVETYWSGYMGPNHNQNGAHPIRFCLKSLCVQVEVFFGYDPVSDSGNIICR